METTRRKGFGHRKQHPEIHMGYRTVITHYYHRYPMSTILGLSICAAIATVSVAASTWLFCRSRVACLTPYRLTPNARIPFCLAVLCCARTARAETTWESLDHLWNNNQQMFWIQLLIPLAALIVVTRLLRCVCCVVPFLVMAGAASTSAYNTRPRCRAKRESRITL